MNTDDLGRTKQAVCCPNCGGNVMYNWKHHTALDMFENFSLGLYTILLAVVLSLGVYITLLLDGRQASTVGVALGFVLFALPISFLITHWNMHRYVAKRHIRDNIQVHYIACVRCRTKMRIVRPLGTGIVWEKAPKDKFGFVIFEDTPWKKRKSEL